MGIFALIVAVLAFLTSWIPAAGILLGIAGGIAGIIFGGIGVINSKGRAPAIVAMCLALVTIVLKLIPGVNLL